jgi:hypothetical protein
MCDPCPEHRRKVHPTLRVPTRQTSQAGLTSVAPSVILPPMDMTCTPREAGQLVAMRRRILAAYGEATAADLAAGLDWYRRAHDAARDLLPADPSRAAGVIAALSPRCHWRTNLVWAAAILEAAERGDASPPRVHTLAMRRLAWRIALGEAPLEVLNGPKVRAFYANITGDLDAVTVDVWAARAAAGRDVARITGRTYTLIARAYREAAAILDMPARDVQAAVWVHVRGSAH